MSTNKPKQRIEVELRSVFSKQKHRQIRRFLEKNATFLGIDDKDVCFFILPGKFLKVVSNLSQNTAKIALKLSSISDGESDFEEIEIPITPSDFDKAVKIFESLPFDQIEWSFQKRRNYLYKGVEVALKWSQSWGYHLELEIIVDDKSKVRAARKTIEKIAKELGVEIMTAEDLKELSKEIEAAYKKGEFKNKATKYK